MSDAARQTETDFARLVPIAATETARIKAITDALYKAFTETMTGMAKQVTEAARQEGTALACLNYVVQQNAKLAADLTAARAEIERLKGAAS